MTVIRAARGGNSRRQFDIYLDEIACNNGGTIDLTRTRQTMDEAATELTLRH